MTLHTPTLFVVIILVSLVLAGSIALVGQRQHAERFFWAWGLSAQALAYTLFALRGQIPDWPSIVLGNVVLSSSFALYATGLQKFRGVSLPPWVTWGPVVCTGIVFWVLIDQTTPRLMASASLTVLQIGILMAILIRHRRHALLRGEWLLLAGGTAIVLMMLMRAWAVGTGVLQIQFVTEGGWIQGLTFTLALTSTLMLAIGLIFMSEQRVESALERREQIQAYRNRVLERLATGTPLKTLLHEIVQGVEELYQDIRCSVLLLDSSGKHLMEGAAPSLPDFYNQAIHGLPIGHGVGSCGTAAHIGQRVVVENVQIHPFWAPFRELARQAQLAACWSQPVLSSTGEVLGTFAMYHAKPYQPNADDIALIEESAILVAFAIERSRLEDQRKAADDAIKFQALHDSLTHLPNRILLMDRLQQAMVVQRRSHKHGALLFIDLDNFKPVNDLYGHATGDQLLIQVAERLKAHSREMDTVARFGGDEFVVLLQELDADPATARQQVEAVTEKMRQVLAQPYPLTLNRRDATTEHLNHSCSASIGVALFSGESQAPEAILQQADAAMYQAKEAGRNQVVFAAPATTVA